MGQQYVGTVYVSGGTPIAKWRAEGRITIRAAESLPVLDFRCLTDEQLLIV